VTKDGPNRRCGKSLPEPSLEINTTRQGCFIIKALYGLFGDKIMTDEETVQLIKKLIKKIKKDFGGKPCPNLNIDCANCRSYIFLGLLEDYLELYMFKP
jgi:hypothetical protein